jgi:cobalamin biosynthesis protein CobT
MGLSHLADYLTVMDVFFEIEQRWINSQATSPEHRIKLQKTKVFNNKALLTVFFGDDENFLDQVKKYYKDTRHLTDDDVPPGVEDPNEDNSEDDSEGDDDSKNENKDSHDKGHEQNKEREQGEDNNDESEKKEQTNKEEPQKEGIDIVDCNTDTKVGKDDNSITKQDHRYSNDSVIHVEQTQQHGEGTSKKNAQCAMSQMFKSVDCSM